MTKIPTQELCLALAADADVADEQQYQWKWSPPLSLHASQLQAEQNDLTVSPSVMKYRKYQRQTSSVSSSVTHVPHVPMTAVSQINSPHWQANSSSVSPEVPHIIWNPMVPHCFLKTNINTNRIIRQITSRSQQLLFLSPWRRFNDESKYVTDFKQLLLYATFAYSASHPYKWCSTPLSQQPKTYPHPKLH